MKVVHLNDHYARVGGAEILLFQTLEALEGRGVENVVIHQYPAAGADARRRYCVPGLGDPDAGPSAPPVTAVRTILHDERPDVIHLYDIGSPAVAEAAAQLAPTVQSVLNHNIYCPGGNKYLPWRQQPCHRPFGLGCLASTVVTRCTSWRPGVLRAAYHRSYRMLRHPRPTIFAALSQYQAQWLVVGGWPAEQIEVLPPCTAVPPLELAAATIDNPPSVLLTGRLVPLKGLAVLVRALAIVRTPCRVLVDGEGPALPAAQRLAAVLGLSARVEFIGWASPEAHAANYRRATIVVVPSIWPEPFGLVGIEAMSHGKPVIASRIGGIPEWLEEGVTGLLVTPDDPRALAQGLDQLLTHPDEARAMGMRGRQCVLERFTPTRYVEALLRLYARAAAQWQLQGS